MPCVSIYWQVTYQENAPIFKIKIVNLGFAAAISSGKLKIYEMRTILCPEIVYFFNRITIAEQFFPGEVKSVEHNLSLAEVKPVPILVLQN